jgi:hypothetical protein
MRKKCRVAEQIVSSVCTGFPRCRGVNGHLLLPKVHPVLEANFKNVGATSQDEDQERHDDHPGATEGLRNWEQTFGTLEVAVIDVAY